MGPAGRLPLAQGEVRTPEQLQGGLRERRCAPVPWRGVLPPVPGQPPSSIAHTSPPPGREMTRAHGQQAW